MRSHAGAVLLSLQLDGILNHEIRKRIKELHDA